jgi:hypothetical protein
MVAFCRLTCPRSSLPPRPSGRSLYSCSAISRTSSCERQARPSAA